MGRGLLIAAFDFSTAHADEFHDWYDLEHLPERRAVAGFGACERWIGDEQWRREHDRGLLRGWLGRHFFGHELGVFDGGCKRGILG